jgi:DNA-binding NarL/FixJ family response regulator
MQRMATATFITLPGIKLSRMNDNHLSEREKEVIGLVAEGMTAQEIAGKLFLSLDTVETHKRHILEKLDARNTAEAVAKAIRMKLI